MAKDYSDTAAGVTSVHVKSKLLLVSAQMLDRQLETT